MNSRHGRKHVRMYLWLRMSLRAQCSPHRIWRPLVAGMAAGTPAPNLHRPALNAAGGPHEVLEIGAGLGSGAEPLPDVPEMVSSNMAGKSPNWMEIGQSPINGPFSSTPCLITGRYWPTWHKVLRDCSIYPSFPAVAVWNSSLVGSIPDCVGFPNYGPVIHGCY